MLHRSALVVAFGVSLVGCFPAPHKETSIPEIRVSLIKFGHPVNAVEVYVGQGEVFYPVHVCKNPVYVGSTQGNGSLIIHSKSKWVFFYDWINDHRPYKYATTPVDLCFKIDGNYVFGKTIDARLDVVEKLSTFCALDRYPDVMVGSKDTYDYTSENKKICK
jgi:hypothetical protein